MDLAGVILGLVLAIAWAEASAWLPKVTRLVIRTAAKRLEPTLQARMEEEWLRYVQDTPGTLGPFVAGCQCLFASFRIRPIEVGVGVRRLHVAAKARRAIESMFDEREFFIHDGRRLRRFRVSARIQASLLFASLILVSWSGFSAAKLLAA